MEILTVPSEDKGVVVDGRDGRAGCGSDVSEDHAGLGVSADGAEVHVVLPDLGSACHSFQRV